MAQRDQWLDGQGYKWYQTVTQPNLGSARMGSDTYAAHNIRTKNYVYIINTVQSSVTAKYVVTRISHLDGSIRVWSYAAFITSLGLSDDSFIQGPRIMANGDELVISGVFQDKTVGTPYKYTGYQVRFLLDNTMETHKYDFTGIYNSWIFDTELEPFLDRTTGNVVYLLSRRMNGSHDPATSTVTTNFVRHHLIMDRYSDTFQNVIMDQGPKIDDFPDGSAGVSSGVMDYYWDWGYFSTNLTYAQNAVIAISGVVYSELYGEGTLLQPALVRVMDPKTGTVLASQSFDKTETARTTQAPNFLPPWDAEDQLRRGKAFIPFDWNGRSVPTEGTLAAHSAHEKSLAVMDWANNAVLLDPRIPFTSRDDDQHHSPTLMAVDNLNNIYVTATRKTGPGFSTTYKVISKYNSVGLLLWEVNSPGLNVSDAKIQPMFFDNQNKIMFGKEYVVVLDTATGEILFEVGDMTMALDTPRWTGSDNRVVFMDVYNTTTALWEPRLLVEQQGLNKILPMEWATLWMVDAIGNITFNIVDSLGVPKPSNVSVITAVNGANTYLNTAVPYTFVEPFLLGVTTGTVGYDIAVTDFPITVVEDQVVTVIIEKVSFDNRNTYNLYTPQDIVDMQTRNDNLGIYHLMNDIDMAGVAFMAAFASEYKPFMGDFYGNGFEISNLVITNDPDYAWVNIGFLAACKNAIVEGITFRGCSANGTGANGAIGILAGRFDNALLANDTTGRPNRLHDVFFENCTVASGSTSGSGIAVGRFVSDTTYSTEPLKNVIVLDSVINPQSGRIIGGAIGHLGTQGTYGTLMLIENIYAEVTINLKSGVAFRTIGGAVGNLYLNVNTEVNAMAAKATVSSGNYYNVGLVGEFYGYDSYSLLRNLGCDMILLNAPTSVVGLMGYTNVYYNNAPKTLTIDRAYFALSSPPVAANADTVIGQIYKSGAQEIIVTNSYHDSEINNFGNLYGTTAKSTAEMKSRANYADWDFAMIWDIKEGIEYPTFIFTGEPPVSIDLEFYEDAGLGVTDLEIRLSTFKRMKAIATYADMSTKDISTNIAIVADPANLTAITGNKIKAIGVGFADLSVTFNRYTEYGFVDLYGPDEVIVTSPNGLTLTAGKKLRLKANASYRDGYVQDVSLLSEWLSDSPGIVSVTADGVVQGIGGGFAGIASTYYDVTGFLTLSVSSMEPPMVSHIDAFAANVYVYFTLLDPIADITYFKATAYLEEAKTTVLDAVDVTINPERFRVSRNKGISWEPIAAEGTVPSVSGEDIYCAKLYVGPLTGAWVEVGAALIDGAGGGTEPSNDDVTAPIVTVLPATGLFNTDQSITITTDEPADVYYTLDETTPTINSTKYTVPITVTEDTILTYFAVDALDNPTYVLTETYAFNRVLPVVSSKLASGTYIGSKSAELVTTKGDIYYTVDGTEPTSASTLYTAPVVLPENDGVIIELKFLAIDAYGNISATVTVAYTINAAPLGSSFTKPILFTAPGGALGTANASMRDVYFLIDGLVVGTSYIIETVNPDPVNTYLDTRMWFYNTSQVQIGYNDDSAATQGLSKAIFTASETSIYAMVDDYGDNNDITFQLTVVLE